MPYGSGPLRFWNCCCHGFFLVSVVGADGRRRPHQILIADGFTSKYGCALAISGQLRCVHRGLGYRLCGLSSSCMGGSAPTCRFAWLAMRIAASPVTCRAGG